MLISQKPWRINYVHAPKSWLHADSWHLDDLSYKLGKPRASLSATDDDHGTRRCRPTNGASGKSSPAASQPRRERQVSRRRWSYGSTADLLSGTKIFRKNEKSESI